MSTIKNIQTILIIAAVPEDAVFLSFVRTRTGYEVFPFGSEATASTLYDVGEGALPQ